MQQTNKQTKRTTPIGPMNKTKTNEHKYLAQKQEMKSISQKRLYKN